MSKRIYTQDQRRELLKNPHILRCSEKSITYRVEFKIATVQSYEQGMTAPQVFEQAGIPLALVGRDQPKNCLYLWVKRYRYHGANGLSEVRGMNARKAGRPKTKGITDKDKIQRLEAEVAYLKAENDFLAKLRAKRAESNSGQNTHMKS